MSCVGGGWWKDRKSSEKPSVSPGEGNKYHALRAFPPSPTSIFYFLFQKAKQKQKQVSQGRDMGWGGLMAYGCGDRFLGSHYWKGKRTERGGSPELLDLPCTTQA